MTAQALSDQARSTLRSTGERVTPARVSVLHALLAAGHALTHHELEAVLEGGESVDRVTLYRVLDWLVERGLACRVSGSDRAWRFSVAPDARAGHAHFQCNHCGKVLCLASSTPRQVGLPPGYRSQSIELTVRGVCAGCST